MNSHGGAEDTEKYVCLPLDVHKRRRDEVRQSEVESPVRGSSKSNSLATESEREELRRVDPGYGTPGRSVGSDEEVRAGDDALSCSAADDPRFFWDVIETSRWCWMAARSKETGIRKHENRHESCSNKERATAAPSINVFQSENRHENVNDVLNRGGDQISRASQTGHTKDVGDVYDEKVSTAFVLASRDSATYTTS